MAYIDNPFKEGQKVVCINDDFILSITDGDKGRIGNAPPVSPKKGEALEVDEILGEFLRFEGYDCHDMKHPDYGWRWWKHTHFAPFEEQHDEAHNSLVTTGQRKSVFMG